MMDIEHEHELWWASEFGDAYTERNQVDPAERLPFWRSIISKTQPDGVLEVGCNRGHNLLAIRECKPDARLIGIDVNEKALMEASEAGIESAFNMPAIEAGVCFWEIADLSFTCGVLIHIPPAKLNETMASILLTSKKYVLAVEYDDTEEVEVEYRGFSDRLWRRPYGKLYEDLGCRLIESGPAEGFDQCTYWLLRVPK